MNPSFRIGLIATVFFSALILGFFFSKVFFRMNETLFTTGGDGLQAYYTAIYHVEHDSTYWRMNGMNYPGGEQVFFTGCQPLVTNTLKFLGIKGYTVGVMNGLMLLSILLCAVVLYLIFGELGISPWIGVPAALCITFGSPQINRLTGHFSLTYQFAIPLFIYLWMRFRRNPKIIPSLAISFTVLIFSATHFYFFGFFAVIALIAWVFYLFSKDGNRNFIRRLAFAGGHFSLQMLLPFALLRTFIASIDTVTDRTESPWGFFQYKAIPETILYPFGYWYDIPMFRRWFTPSLNFEWEGVSYIGILGLFAAVTGLLFWLKSLVYIKEKRPLLPFKDELLNILFYAALAGFILAIALPFRMFDQFIYNHIGYFKQLRGIARFAWITYYGTGIIGTALLYQFSQKFKSAWILGAILVFVSSTEAYRMTRLTAEGIPAPPDYFTQKTEHPDYAPLAQLNPSDFQAIIPLPYFHIGSENIWLAPEGRIYEIAFMSSAFTGLPLTAVLLNRNSISDTFEHLRMIQEASGDPVHFARKLSDRPYLIIRDKSAEITVYEKEMTDSATLLAESPSMIFYRLNADYFEKRAERMHREILSQKEEPFFRIGEINSSDSADHFLYLFYPGEYEEPIKRRYVRLFKGILPTRQDSVRMSFSVRILNLYTDLIPRTAIQINYMGPDGMKEEYFPAQKHLVSTSRGTGLVEFSFDYRKDLDIEFHFVNFDITDDRNIRWNSVLIKPAESTIWFDAPEQRMWNNRWFDLKPSDP